MSQDEENANAGQPGIFFPCMPTQSEMEMGESGSVEGGRAHWFTTLLCVSENSVPL